MPCREGDLRQLRGVDSIGSDPAAEDGAEADKVS
jgi:hypothetical protein